MSRRCTSAKWLVPVLGSLLILGILSAELPELMSLLDNTANDFVVRKIGRRESATRLALAGYDSVLPAVKHFEYDRCADPAVTFVRAKVASPELFVLHSVLRR